MFIFALSSGLSRGGGLSSGWPPKRGSTVHLKYMCMFSFIQMLKEKGYKFDVAFTSVLKRAIKTLFLIQEELDLHWIPVERHWRLNERHYGALQGLNKAETAAEHGEDQVKVHIYTQHIPGVKNHLSWSPGQVKFQTGQAYIFTQCPADK